MKEGFEIGHSTRAVKPFGVVEVSRSGQSRYAPRITCGHCGSSDIFIGHAMFRFALCRRCGNYWRLGET